MGIIEIITLIGGVAFFLYGMNIMSNGLEKMSGGKLESTLKRMTSNPFKSLALGAGITIAIQSSSAMTVMLVGLVNSGIMNLEQTVGLIMGSNIGTTFTAWLTSLIGIEDSGNVFTDLLKPANFSLVFALVGVLFISGKNKRRKDIGDILVGFAILMCGMGLMGDSVNGLKDSPEFAEILTAFNNPILGVLVGTVFTGVIQSSAASVSILQGLSMTGHMTYGMALPIIMGQNIGTCVTAIISSFGVNRNAKRVSVVHISFNIIGTVICLILFYGLNAIFHFAFMNNIIDPFGIALCHFLFNLFTTAILLPFSKTLVKIANKVIPEKEGEDEEVTLLDKRLLNTPSIAISECRNITIRMSRIVKEALLDALNVLNKYDKNLAQKVEDDEGVVDKYEDKLGTYLVQLSSHEITIKDSQNVSTMLHSIGNFERISDHAVDIVKTAEELTEKKLNYSVEAQKEIAVAENALREIIEITFTAFETGDTELARKVEPLEQVIDRITAEMRSNHITRLQAGNCTIELGFILNDLINGFERVSDHCSNIAVAMIEVAEGVFDTHQYLNDVKSGNDENFRKEYEFYKEKYKLA
ncbi:MAG: Na/Pi cotransporter family protein [Clostridia bacterium]|nr:Na/Pi cotransporter family protein [Clostridia bacterium]